MAQQERNFGFTMAGAFCVLSLLAYFKRDEISFTMVGISLLFLVLAVFTPRILKFPRKWWILLGDKLGFINSYIILTVIFFIMFVPIGLLLRLFKGDILNLRLSKVSSYWIKSDDKKNNFHLQF